MRKGLFGKIITGALIISLTLGFAGCGKAATNDDGVKTIHAVTGGSPAPYITVDENGNYSGYDIEVLNAVFEKLPQYKLDLQTADFDAIFTGLTAGNYELAVNNFSYREERAETYYFSFPYDEITYVFVQRAGDEPLTSLKDAADRGYKIESNAGGNVTNANGRQIRVRPTETVSEIDEYGNFHRQPNHFTKGFGKGENPVEKDRYILFWAKGCHWSNRASIARER